MDKPRVRSNSCPDLTNLKITPQLETQEVHSKSTLKVSSSSYHIHPFVKQENDSLVSISSELYGSELSEASSDDHVTVVFNWNYGGNEVYLVEFSEKSRRMIKMVKSTNCFTTIQELPRKLFRYRYLVDNVLQHSPDDPCIKTDEGIVNFIDITNFKPSDYSVPREPQEMNVGTFGNEVPGPNYMTMEPPFYPDVLNYRSPDFENSRRMSNDIHVISNHIYEDSTAKSFLGEGYNSYLCVYRWANELSKVQCPPRSVCFIYVTLDEHGSEYKINQKLAFLNLFQVDSKTVDRESRSKIPRPHSLTPGISGHSLVTN